ncbi:MAG: hypothetical protein IT352_15490 [Gemmatimonadales bacterium]|nr:hypothetical protein [Gemmatimonadales bacterium]
MIGILGPVATILEVIPGVVAAPPVAQDSPQWDSVVVDRGGWATGPGPVVPRVPVSGLYLVTIYWQAVVNDAGPAQVEWHGMAYLNAGGGSARIDAPPPGFGIGDGLAIGGAASIAFLLALTAGDEIRWGYSIGDADPTAASSEVTLIRMTLSRVR